ncbi:hypothetical protein ILUMI_15741 [Ignelater luminosus]|uniref:Reverse transcriptase domain-containing protein n=1 Tax=Ignelater luminosus TaxID=2038154 RepID=A0A8K0CSB0_IGNLU|nr:hypothetical protein ILUMI_15741 [Ignelater luminosus]
MCDEIIAKKPKTFAAAYQIAHTLEVTRNTADEVKTPGTHSTPKQTYKIGYEKPHAKNSGKQGRNKSKQRHQGQHQRNLVTSCGLLQHNSQARQGSQHACAGCGEASQCRFRDAKCNKCGKKEHISRVCRSNTRANQITETKSPAEYIDMVQRLSKIEIVGVVRSSGRQLLEVQLEDATVKMELDTGAPCSIMSKKTFEQINFNCRLQKADRNFASYTGYRINCIGRTRVTVRMGATTKKLNLYIVDGEFDTLLSREWISEFAHEIDFRKFFSNSTPVHQMSSSNPLTSNQESQRNSMLSRYDDVFSDKPSKLTGPPAKIKLKPEATPVFSGTRDVPLALLDYSEWSSTTHIVAKKNGKLRITGNYKPTLNPRILIDEHPIPKVEHLFNKLRGATLFCHLDITDAYAHLEVDKEFSHALTLNTPTHGLIRPTRALYGAANIPAIWQRYMNTVLQDLPNVVNFFDDIIVYADRFDNLLQALISTLERLKTHRLKLNHAKCSFAEPVLEALGHKVDASGVHKSDAHIRAVQDAPKPTTPEELQLFLGKATYCSPDLSTRDCPLRDMLLKDTFAWTPAGTQAYWDIKEALISPQVLMLYDPSLPLMLATEASKTGLGVVLSHRLNNGQERPIAYASRTMSATE